MMLTIIPVKCVRCGKDLWSTEREKNPRCVTDCEPSEAYRLAALLDERHGLKIDRPVLRKYRPRKSSLDRGAWRWRLTDFDGLQIIGGCDRVRDVLRSKETSYTKGSNGNWEIVVEN